MCPLLLELLLLSLHRVIPLPLIKIIKEYATMELEQIQDSFREKNYNYLFTNLCDELKLHYSQEQIMWLGVATEADYWIDLFYVEKTEFVHFNVLESMQCNIDRKSACDYKLNLYEPSDIAFRANIIWSSLLQPLPSIKEMEQMRTRAKKERSNMKPEADFAVDWFYNNLRNQFLSFII